MYVPKIKHLIKLDQKERDKLYDSLMPKYNLPCGFCLGATVSYSYYYDKVKVFGKAIVIGVKKTALGNKISLYCDNNVVLKVIYNANLLCINILKSNNKKIRRAKLNYMIKK